MSRAPRAARTHADPHGARGRLRAADNARAVYDALAGPKELTWLEGGQIDFYDRPEYMERARTRRAILSEDADMNDEREQIRAVVTRVAHLIDAKRWTELRALYASEVETDYTSLFGGTPQRAPGDALIGVWTGALTHVTTQHLLGPIDVALEGTRAKASCHVRAAHYADGAPGGDSWEVLGHYVFQLTRSDEGRWLITSMTLLTTRQVGNSKLLQEAGAR